MTATITQPGVYDMPEAEYHAHPALSSTGARKLLPPSCPALFKYWLTHPEPPKAVFDFGHAAHRAVLGVGLNIVEVKHDSWRTKAASEQADAIRANGGVPLLTKDCETVTAMEAALRAHPVAAALLSGDGRAEASLFWEDGEITRRARVDWLASASGGRLILPDYKTAVSAEPKQFARAAMNFGYHQQAAWYLDGVRALGLGEEPVFVFCVQEKTPPYLVTLIELDPAAIRIGDLLNRRAIDLFTKCTTTDTWPGYARDVALASLPNYYEREFEDQQ